MKKLLVAVLLLPVICTQAQIGIGTTSPNSTLDVRGALSTAVTTFTANTTAGSSDNLLVFTGTSAATLTLPTAVGITGREYWIKNASSNSSTLTIATTASQTVDGVSSWSLTQIYKVIRLVSNGSNWYAVAESLPGSSAGTGWLLGGNNVVSVQNLGTTSNYDLPFITNNTEKMRLTASGNLGIGITTPTSNLHVANSGTVTNTIGQFLSPNLATTNGTYLKLGKSLTNGDEADIIYNWTGANSAANYLGFSFYSKPVYMVLTNAGNVGIGTTTPVAALHVVKSNAGGNVLTLQNTSASGFSSADFYSSTGALAGTFGFGNASVTAPFIGRTYFNSYGNDFVLTNGSAAPFLVQGSTNNVGINNTAPTEKLDVTGNIRFSGALMPGNDAGTLGDFLMSGGSGVVPTWIDPSSYLSSLAWMQDGNTLSAIKNFGTISNHDLPIITNNTEKMRITAIGTVGIGTSTFSGTNPEELIVDAGTTGSAAFQNVIVGKGNTNSYAQLNIQNGNAGTAASSDVVATADNGTESINYIDMGINSSGYSAVGVLGGSDNGYLYSTGNDFVIGNATAFRDVIFFTGGTAKTDERLRVTPNGITLAGSFKAPYRSGTGAYTLLATDYVIINTGAAATWTLPDPTLCAGRIYRLLNQGTGSITLSRTVRTASATTSTTLVVTAGSNFYEIMSDGTEWRRIN